MTGFAWENAYNQIRYLKDETVSSPPGAGVSDELQESENTNEQPFSNVKVMVIDDSKTIRRSAETLLKKVGCDVMTAVDGFEALAKITVYKPDIIFVEKDASRLAL